MFIDLFSELEGRDLECVSRFRKCIEKEVKYPTVFDSILALFILERVRRGPTSAESSPSTSEILASWIIARRR
jgi:hypothetical protein